MRRQGPLTRSPPQMTRFPTLIQSGVDAMIRNALIAASLAGLALVAQPASAQESREVAYGDLDLSKPEGQEALRSRLRSAARDVCAMTTARVTLKEQMASQECYRFAMKSAEQRYAAAKLSSARSR